jgi:hypothetical protein
VTRPRMHHVTRLQPTDYQANVLSLPNPLQLCFPNRMQLTSLTYPTGPHQHAIPYRVLSLPSAGPADQVQNRHVHTASTAIIAGTRVPPPAGQHSLRAVRCQGGLHMGVGASPCGPNRGSG